MVPSDSTVSYSAVILLPRNALCKLLSPCRLPLPKPCLPATSQHCKSAWSRTRAIDRSVFKRSRLSSRPVTSPKKLHKQHNKRSLQAPPAAGLAPTMSASDAASHSIAKLQAAANVFTRSLQPSTKATAMEPAPSKQELQTLTDGLKLEASKVGLVWGSNTPSHAEVESLLAALEQRHSQLLTLLCRAGFSAGPTLLHSLQSAAAPVTAACVQLLNFVASEKHVRDGEAAVQTGKVWAACDAVSTTALDSKTAIGRKLLHMSRSIKDNIREVQEVISDSGSHAPEQKQSHDSYQDSDVDLDFDTEALGPVEIRTAEASLGLIQTVLDILKLLVRIILTEKDVSSETNLVDWESLLFHAKGLADVSNDLAAALFAPQDRDEIVSAADSLQTGCELVLDEIPDRLQTAHTKVIESLAQHVSDAHSSVIGNLSVGVSGLTLED